jgi:uncharacterized phage protein (TIGR01671 family)
VRPIKFRAWSPSEKRFVQDLTTWLKIDNNGNFLCQYPSSESLKIETLEYSQFTGLHDKNGKEIWEGDILNYCGPHCITYNGKSEVVFEKGAFQRLFSNWGNTRRTGNLNDSDLSDYEVLGNIYENPELLK